MYKSYVPYLQHIFDECLYVRSVITDEMQVEEFMRDETLKRAVTRSLSIIGEATKKIPGDVKYAWQSVSWREMAGMRKLIDVSKLHSLGWHHHVEIEEGVAKLFQWYKSSLES